MFKLYYFNPELVDVEGYTLIDCFEDYFQCIERATFDNCSNFRIEQIKIEGSSIVFETKVNEEE